MICATTLDIRQRGINAWIVTCARLVQHRSDPCVSNSKVLIILSPRGDEANYLIDEVSEEYKRQFDQESVLKVVSNACVGF